MIAELYEALTHAKIPPEMARQASEAVEEFIIQNNKHSHLEYHTEKIVPLEKENIGIRAEIRILSETMKAGFEAMEKQVQAVDKRVDLLTKLFWLIVGLMVTGFSTVITMLFKFVMK